MRIFESSQFKIAATICLCFLCKLNIMTDNTACNLVGHNENRRTGRKCKLPTLGTCSTWTIVQVSVRTIKHAQKHSFSFSFKALVLHLYKQIHYPVCQKPFFVEEHFWRDEEKKLKIMTCLCYICPSYWSTLPV